MWCIDSGYTNEDGEVDSMKYADEYMKTKEYEQEHMDYNKLLLNDYIRNKDKWIQNNL
jgi:hypothetical protein